MDARGCAEVAFNAAQEARNSSRSGGDRRRVQLEVLVARELFPSERPDERVDIAHGRMLPRGMIDEERVGSRLRETSQCDEEKI